MLSGPRLNLNATLAGDAPADQSDTINTKYVLQDFGYYVEPDYGMTVYPDQRLFDGIRKFQKDNGLRIDGRMNPGGPTESALNIELRKTQNTREKQYDDEAEIRARIAELQDDLVNLERLARELARQLQNETDPKIRAHIREQLEDIKDEIEAKEEEIRRLRQKLLPEA
ncbi:MAG: hypothetical protein QGF16_03265 [Rhodospirillales bacterium]|jgi:hypothetical protein|nr:hypothetical protein [Rhodospirillales bacterium]|tara:strand:+ start:2032 stop:2538 length:507 start_codon:yes stop_codon:yes gene_type:complete